MTDQKLQVPVWVEPGVMRPPDSGMPMVLIGPGTGVAPFRAFLEDRLAASAQGVSAPPTFNTQYVHIIYPSTQGWMYAFPRINAVFGPDNPTDSGKGAERMLHLVNCRGCRPGGAELPVLWLPQRGQGLLLPFLLGAVPALGRSGRPGRPGDGVLARPSLQGVCVPPRP